ncbi:MAG: DEAD/DEAH box helicase [Gammaproteobacteria bacterium]|nr:DEAD/DEAH box helicase [Gammaproteobacteria bacterium]
MAQTVLTETTFESLDLPETLLRGIREAGFTHCTPIQELALPPALRGEDVAGQAQTGTGKSAAFLLATMARLLRRPVAEEHAGQPRALILAPTRELAIQIHRDAEVLGKFSGLRLALAYGGTGYHEQREAIAAGCDILTGTPGRVIDYYKQGVFHLKATEVIVLDEADRMFDLGFIKDIRYVLRRLPPPSKRLSMLFSATMSARVSELAYEHMNEPTPLAVEADKVTADRVRQTVYHTAMEEKLPLLLGLLQHQDPRRSIVFVNTKRIADRLQGYLEGNGIESAVLSGDVPQTKRQKLLLRFQRGELPVLVATDVAARGLHIPDVSHVFNYDLPQDAEDYVHRIGRTARLGKEGDAISFACEEYAYSLPEIEQFIGHKIPVEPVESDMLVTPKPPVRRPRRRSQEGPGGRRRRRRN